MRKRVWRLHSWLGLAAGIVLLVVGVTGSLLVFHKQLEGLFQPGIYRVPEVGEARLPADRLLASATEELPGHVVAGWVVRSDPAESDFLYVIEKDTTRWRGATIDPYTAELLRGPVEFEETLTGWLLLLHYELFAEDLGMAVTGVFALLLCALGVSGVWLYRDFWKNIFRLRWRASGRIFFSDLHKAIGISSVVFNLLLGFTGAWWNLSHAFEHLLGHHEESPVSEMSLPEETSLDALMISAKETMPDLSIGYISLPTAESHPVVFYGRSADGAFRSDYGSRVSIDPESGEIVETHDIREAGALAQIYDAFEPVHFGSFGGLPVQILWCVVGLSPGALAVSGSLIWWNRRRRNKSTAAPSSNF